MMNKNTPLEIENKSLETKKRRRRYLFTLKGLSRIEKKRKRHITTKFLVGVGSVIDLAPSTNYNRLVLKKNVRERMDNAWVRTGQQIQRSIDKLTNERNKK